MAVTLFGSFIAAPFSPAPPSGLWTAGPTSRYLLGPSPSTDSDSTLPSGSGSFALASGETGLALQLVSSSAAALSAGTLSGTVEILAELFAGNGTMTGRYVVWVSQGATSSVRGVALDYAGGWTTPNNGNSFVSSGIRTLTDVSVQAGDRIIVEIGFQLTAAGSGATFLQPYMGGGYGPDPIGGQGTPASGKAPTHARFSDTNNVIGTSGLYPPLTLYLTNTDTDFTPSTIRGSWSDSTSSAAVVRQWAKAPSGTVTTQAVAEVSSTAGSTLLGRFVSPPVTVAGSTGGSFGGNTKRLRGQASLRESAAAANMFVRYHLYATQGSSDTLRGTVASGVYDTTSLEATTTQAAKPLFPYTTSSVSLQVGDRLVLELGYYADNTVTTSYTGTLQYGGTGSALGWNSTTGVGWMELFGLNDFFVETGTTHSASGTAAGTSSATGAADVTPPSGTTHNATGTTDGAAAATGGLVQTDVATGTAAATSSASGDLIQTDVVTGTGTSTSSSTGTPSISSSVTSSTSGVSTSSGIAAVTRATTGTAAGTSSTTGASALTTALSGTTTGTSTSSGTTLATRITQGTAAVSAGSTGIATGGSGSSGQADSTGASSGTSSITRSTAGTTSGTSSSTGTPAKTTSGSGTTSGTAAATGTANIVGAPVQVVTGTVSGVSSATGAQARVIGLTGASSSISSTTSLMTLVALAQGTAAGSSTASGGLLVGIADRFVHRPSIGSVERPDSGKVIRPVSVQL